jgi:hypothetical protein
MYDFHARMYDPVLGRWHAPDPMNQFDSPYNAMGDNPVVNIDPDGMMAIGGIREWFRRTFLNKTGSGIQKVGRGRDRSEKISKGSGAGNVTSTGVVETFNDLYSVGMAVVHAFEISTQLNAGQENVINGANYNYYFDRFGTLTAKTVRDASNNAIFIAQGDMTNPTWKEYDEGFIRQYLAVIVGEAGQHDDAAGVGAVIMNRFAAKANVNKPVAMDGNFIKKLGGKGQYDAISVGENDEKSYYYKVMHSSFDVVFGSNTGFQERIQGGLSALSAKTLNEVNGFLNTPHFWEGAKEYKIHAKGPMKVINENWFTKHVANSEIYMTGSAGGSYFFNYTNKTPYLQKRRWP